ncbi:pyruvate kinase [Sediminispirochaeta smaragdinae]|uniref:Pyruvate kinase n=1 Tax=Sediminispirochaeta smaragdinae (strain DSM 11293 / JCM 15392 / SEBR 4228) TaxID=573413 RepID=E1R6T7_SEDSS|nr:pyruvate kinase [Sediminispirochaeta smaragdinae]ADK79219.1 pyruvate kinase [Sediminispirochaeta smaragdinae DSM 11293]
MKYLRKTRIVATIGPACDDLAIQKELLKAGVNVARFNFSHGNHEEQAKRIASMRRASEETSVPVALMMDTKGPEIRTGNVKGEAELALHSGFEIVLTSRHVEGTREELSVSYQNLPSEVEAGDHIFIADGVIDLEVLAVSGPDIRCLIRNGGMLGSKKNVNVPGVKVGLPAITEKDREDIRFAVEHQMDYIAASFIRRPEDVEEIREILKQYHSSIRIIAKIENQEGLDNIDDIIRISDGVMVARGDLGVQLSTEQIPLAQKRIIGKCMRQGKPVITATQMLDSMIHNPSPTRAELTDVANAIFDGTDAVMLSGETAGGAFPVRSVETMGRIAEAVETSEEYRRRCTQWFETVQRPKDIGHTIARAAYVVASDIDASAIVAPTLRGNTPRILSNYRPNQLIIAVTTSEESYRQLLLHWGIFPILSAPVKDSDMMIQNALRLAREHGYVAPPDRVVTTAGIPLNSPQPLNTIKIHFLGTILNRGHAGMGDRCSGALVKAENFELAQHRLRWDGTEILLTGSIGKELFPRLSSLRGIVIEGELSLSPEEVRKIASKIVIIADVPNAMDNFEDGQLVTLDGKEKIIYEGFM